MKEAKYSYKDYGITTKALAARLCCSPRHLMMLRAAGKGPDYVRFGPRMLRYSASSVDAWIAAHASKAGAS